MNRIFTRIFLSYLIIGLSSALVITVIYYFIMRDALISRTYDQLSSINILKKDQVDHYLAQTKKNVEFLFTHDFFLEHFYPSLVRGQTHEKFPPNVADEILAIQELFAFKAIGILDAGLNEIYSTRRGHADFSGILKNSGLAETGADFYIIDASDSGRETTMLYVVALHHLEEQAFIVIEENFKKLEDILHENTGMGETGESYIVGEDYHLRSGSRFFPDQVPFDISVKADQSNSEEQIIRDYRDIEVVSVRRRLEQEDLRWSIYSEIDLDEAMQPVVVIRNYLIIIAVLLLIVTAGVTAMVSNAISKPILYLREIIIKLSKGMIAGQQANVPNRDEVGQIAEAINQLIGGLHRTTQFAYAIGEGRFDARYEKLSDNDALGGALIHMRDQIKALNEKEINLVREKAAALLEGQENERKRITRDLHDGVGQLLTLIRLRTEGITGHDSLVQEIKTLLAETSDEVKRISFNVMPSSLVDFGLEPALEGLCKQVRKSSGVEIDFQYVREVERTLTFDIVVAAYRIAQEALNNVLKHSGAKNMSLYVIEKEVELFMMAEDDGKGFSPGGWPTLGFGLRSMEERAKLLGGNAFVYSEPGKGTAIEVHIPFR